MYTHCYIILLYCRSKNRSQVSGGRELQRTALDTRVRRYAIFPVTELHATKEQVHARMQESSGSDCYSRGETEREPLYVVLF